MADVFSPQTRRGAFGLLAVAAGLDMASVAALVLGLDVLQTGQAQPWLVGLSVGLFVMAASLIVSAARALRELDVAPTPSDSDPS